MAKLRYGRPLKKSPFYGLFTQDTQITFTHTDLSSAPSGSEVAETAPNAVYIDGIAVPEGIDPSFLEALPDSIRRVSLTI